MCWCSWHTGVWYEGRNCTLIVGLGPPPSLRLGWVRLGSVLDVGHGGWAGEMLLTGGWWGLGGLGVVSGGCMDS